MKKISLIGGQKKNNFMLKYMKSFVSFILKLKLWNEITQKFHLAIVTAGHEDHCAVVQNTLNRFSAMVCGDKVKK